MLISAHFTYFLTSDIRFILFNKCKNAIILDREMNLYASKGKTIDAMRVIVIMRTRIRGKNIMKGSKLYFSETFSEFLSEDNIQGREITHDFLGEASPSLWVRIGEGQVWLDV